MSGVSFWRDSGNPIGPTFSPNPWDTATILARSTTGKLVAKQFPGICEIKGVAELQLDKAQKPGDDGAKLTVTGYQPGPFEIACTVWTSDQWDALQEIIDLIWRRPNKKARLSTLAFDISSPALDALNIHACVLMAVSLPERTSEDGARVVRFKCQESVKRSATNQVKTAKPAPTVTPNLRLERPKNSVPPKASTEKFTPAGAATPPASGPF